MTKIEDLVGKVSTEADRKKQSRKKAKQIQENTDGTLSEDCPPEKEREKEGEPEKESEREIYGKYQNVLLSPSELSLLKQEHPAHADTFIEKLSEYLKMSGKKYQSHYAVLCRWMQEDIKEPSSYKEDDSL